MTIVVTDKELTGSYEDEAKKMRDHGIIIHTVGWGEVSSTIENSSNKYLELRWIFFITVNLIA